MFYDVLACSAAFGRKMRKKLWIRIRISRMGISVEGGNVRTRKVWNGLWDLRQHGLVIQGHSG